MAAGSNGKLIVIGMVGIAFVWAMAGLLWKDAPPPLEERVKQPLPPLPAELAEDEQERPQVADKDTAGAIEVSNVPEGKESRVEKSRKRRAAEAAARLAAGEDEDENPFQDFVDAGQPLTAAAMKDPDMRSMTGDEDAYDPVTEARQRFNELETDLLAEVPLTPESWRAVTAAHQDDVKGVFQRAKALTDAGNNDEARELLEEWAELQGKYQAQAYGRAPQPVQ